MFRVKKVPSFGQFLSDIDEGRTEGLVEPISCENWPREYIYAPGAAFAIAHNGEELFLKYFVDEECAMALVTEDNGRVSTDSCVEMFISFDESGYYNFEFNCIGTTLLAFRKLRNESERAPAEVLATIYRRSSLGSEPFAEQCGDMIWEIDIRIPRKAFFRHEIGSLSGLKARANFYKCGDGLSKPHYLSWNPIGTPSPDFHNEAYFGEIEFE